MAEGVQLVDVADSYYAGKSGIQRYKCLCMLAYQANNSFERQGNRFSLVPYVQKAESRDIDGEFEF
jgi:hypothetical protein